MILLSSACSKFSDVDKSQMDMASFPTDYKDAAKIARIIYSRPLLKGRSVNNWLNRKVWRTGLMKRLKSLYTRIWSNQLKAGTYTLYTIPEKDSYTIIINKT
jgi:hypothetical protein